MKKRIELLKWIAFTILKGKQKTIYSVLLDKNKEKRELTKKALLSYITAPFWEKNINQNKVPFSNTGIALSIVRVLNNLGYLVDVVEYTDKSFAPKRQYDLFIGHGGFNFTNIAESLPSKCKKIYFSAGPYWKTWNEKEKERIDKMNIRRNTDYSYERLDVSEEEALISSDAIVALGNKVVKESYKKFNKVYILNNAAFSDDHFEKMRKDHNSTKKNFLYFAGGGNVHKGLDLLLEVFSKINANLFICQLIDPKFYKIYQHELEDFPNIHLKGWVRLRSKEYYDLVDKCSFLIYPSCADGSPGSVVESLHQGLIPVLSEESTVDTNSFGVTFRKNTVQEIESVVKGLTKKSDSWCEKMSHKTRHTALKEYSEESFLNNLTKVIQNITKEL